MTMARGGHTEVGIELTAVGGREVLAPSDAQLQPTTNLAALLDRFTQSVTEPDAHTVGDFAATLGALHGELAMLARHFGAGSDASMDAAFDDIFPMEATIAAVEPGLAASEELQHLCWQLSR